ncbi:hypothetical protein FBU30_009460 [Linnemannia zychae]|nr:hypothetical protein FBU30_009460 [Linnemannia zychae]
MEIEFDSRPIRPGSLTWSEDNILALITPSSVNIITPCLPGALDQSPTNGKYQKRYVAFNGRLFDWSMVTYWLLASKRYLVLDQYLSTYWGAQPDIDPDMADKLECVSLAWSPKIQSGAIGSVLALGNKAGYITVWHVTNKENVRCIESWKTESNSWVVQLSWSPWTLEGDRYVSMLAYATADGLVRVQEVKFSLLWPLEDIEVTKNIMTVSHQTLHPCTVIKWRPTLYETVRERNILAFSRGNRVNVWLPDSNRTVVWRQPIAKAIADIVWDIFGERLTVFFMDGKHTVLLLQDEEFKVESEQIEVVHQNIISRCHMQSRTNITQDDGDADNANGDDDGAEDEHSGSGTMASKLQLHIVSGSNSAERTQFATAYYVTSPFHMEFQRERYQSSTLMLSKAFRTMQSALTDALFNRLETYIQLPNAALTRNPSFHFWDILLLLGESWKSESSGSADLQRLTAILNGKSKNPTETLEILFKREALLGTSTSLETRLMSTLFNDPVMNAERVGVYLQSQLKRCELEKSLIERFEEYVHAAEACIRKYTTQSILNLLNEVSTTSELSLKDNDLSLFLLLCDSVLLFHRDDKSLLAIAEKTYHRLRKLGGVDDQLRVLQEIKKGVLPAHISFETGREECPACVAEVKLEDLQVATCANGHTWRRCSVTLLVIADFHPRTCLGCGRKTLMVPDIQAGEPALPNTTATSWLEVVLRAHSLCGYCGERFFTALRRRA